MAIVQAEFDGRVFIPCETVQLPVGARVQVVIPGPPRPPTAEEDRQWQELLQQIDSSEPEFPTVEEALRYSRKRP